MKRRSIQSRSRAIRERTILMSHAEPFAGLLETINHHIRLRSRHVAIIDYFDHDQIDLRPFPQYRVKSIVWDGIVE